MSDKEKIISRKVQICERCKGTGRKGKHKNSNPCPGCNGKGAVVEFLKEILSEQKVQVFEKCPTCGHSEPKEVIEKSEWITQKEIQFIS
jgi:DnaJ-class molecular chaperone